VSLIAHYRLDGNAVDDIGGQNGTVAGTVSYASGKLGNSFVTGASTGRINTPIPDSTFARPFAASAWVRIKAWGLSQGVFGTRSSPNGWMLYRNSGDGNGLLRFYMHYTNTSDSNTTASHTFSGFPLNEWFHVVVMRTPNGGYQTWFNGTRVANSTAGSFKKWNTAGADLSIGAGGSDSAWTTSQMDIDDVRIYDHILSKKEIQHLAKAKFAHYKFSDPIVNNSDQNVGTAIVGTAGFSSNTPVGPSSYDSGSGNNSVRLQGDLNPANFTLSFWLNISSSQTWASRFDVLSGTASGGAGRLLFYRLNTTTLRFHCQYDTTTITVDIPSSNTIFVNQWAHVVLTSSDSNNSNNMEVFVNGSSINTATPGQVYNFTNQDLYLMSDRGTQYWTNGLIADFRVYNQILTEAEINELYHNRGTIDRIGNYHIQYIDNAVNYDEDIDANNLQLNGYGELGNNTGMPVNFTYEGSGIFQRTSTTSTDLVPTTLLTPIRGNGRDQFDQYTISAEFRHIDQTSRYFYMLVCYDKYKQRINNEFVNIWADRATTITTTLVNGATTVQFDNISNWFDNGVPGHVNGKSFSIWLPDDDPIYVPLRYSRRWVQYSDIDKTAHTVTLVSSWSGGTIPSGTLVANSQSGATYSYIGASNVWTTADWVYREGISSSTPNISSMRFGSEYITVGWLLNRDASSPPSTTQIRNIRLWNSENNQNPIYFTDKLKITGTYQTKDISEVGPTLRTQAWLRFDDSTVGDYSEYKRTVSSNNITFGTGPTGNPPSAVFNGTNGDITITNFSYPATWFDPFALACWIYVPTGATWSNGNRGGILARGSFANSHGLLRTTTNNRISMFVRGGASTLEATGDITRDTWHHVVGVWNGLECKLYIDGVQTGINTGQRLEDPQSANWEMGTAVGYAGSAGNRFEGELADVRIYDRDITDEEIQLLYNITSPTTTNRVSISKSETFVRAEIKE